MLGFLRSIGIGWLAASFGAVVFQLSGTLAANAHFFMRMEPLIWLPAGFWALERIFHARGAQRLPPLAGFACALGLCWLAGFPPYALAVSIAFGLYILELVRRTWAQQGIKARVVLRARRRHRCRDRSRDRDDPDPADARLLPGVAARARTGARGARRTGARPLWPERLGATTAVHEPNRCGEHPLRQQPAALSGLELGRPRERSDSSSPTPTSTTRSTRSTSGRSPCSRR